MESMGVASRCGCKKVYRFPHITYPYSSCICSFFCSSIYIYVIGSEKKTLMAQN